MRTATYSTWEERQELVRVAEAAGETMLHDERPIGGVPTLTFGPEPSPPPPTPEQLANETKAAKKQAAKVRAIADIKANQTGAPWGKILFDLAVAQGLIDE